MSQTLPPPPKEHEQHQRHEPRTAVILAAPPPPSGETLPREQRSPQAWWATAIKWPLRHLLKGVYLGAVAVKKHRVTSLVIFLLLFGLLASTVIIYQATHPARSARTPSVVTTQPDTPFTIVTSQAPPLPQSVINWLHGHKTYNAQELWSSLDARGQQSFTQQGLDQSGLASLLAKQKAAGLQFQQFIYTGGYVLPDGSSNYTVEVVEHQGSASAVVTWFFQVDQSGQIAGAYDLSPQAQS